MYQGSFKKREEDSRVLKKVSSVFQETFIEVLFCNFDVARISSQLPEQKEGLFDKIETELTKVLRRSGSKN